MRIMITEAEIKEAIADKVLSQMSINEGMELKIEISATRGPDGMTATIDVAPKSEPTLEVAKTVARARRTPAAPAAAKAATVEKAEADAKGAEEAAKEAAETVQQPEAAQAAEAADNAPEAANEAPSTATEEAAPAPTGSIFAKLQKPVNNPAE